MFRAYLRGKKRPNLMLFFVLSGFGGVFNEHARPKLLADEIGSLYLHVSIDIVVYVFLSLFQTPTGKRTRFKVNVRTDIKNLGIQNIQACASTK
ncbi:putative NAD(+) synthase (glutamine-hydrolyzing) [Helianthus annuus]|nr:putative NAD(+) synthase (glutamine-hydrolyzing) [Helianthus annuus]